MSFRTWLKRSCFLFLMLSSTSTAWSEDEETTSVDDPNYLDGYVGLGGGFASGDFLNKDFVNGSSTESTTGGSRKFVRVEFARLRKWISVDARAGFGQDYNDFGGLFRIAKHWRFNGESATGISLGAGLGAMYSAGIKPDTGDRLSFIELIGAPFVRFIWDWGYSMGLGLDIEYQLVPKTMFTDDTSTNKKDDITNLQKRFYVGLSLLLEVD